MGETVRFHETLRRLAMIDEAFAEDAAGTGLGPVVSGVPDVAAAPEEPDGHSRAPGQAHGDREMLDQVVRSLFRAGLSLQAAVDVSGGVAAQRIAEAQQCLDRTIREIRGHVFAARDGGGRLHPVAPDGKPHHRH
jgi:hypothetical protein